MSARPPRVAVIVPVRDRKDLLDSLLRALDGQHYDDFEVVIVDDGSTDGSRQLAERSTVKGRPVRVLAAEGRGAVAARCLGVEQTTAPYLAFTDSDCQPDPAWLAAAVAALDDGADLAHGPTAPTRAPGPLERTVWSEREGLYPTCNVLYRRDAYTAAGGFDRATADRLGFRPGERAKGLGFGEDTLLAWRVRDNGGTAAYVPEARVLHHVFPRDISESMSRSIMAAAFPGLVREAPALRNTMLKHRVFLGGMTRAPMYLAAAAAVSGRKRLATVAVGAWAVAEWRQLGRTPGSTAERAFALPVQMVLDVVIGGSLAVGSVLHRQVVL